ncbi:WD repeat-containing protein 26-like [Chenopodium quinoa]|uniref:WD repeat-containing protein 26-like n=1 Tax=Chenopodium quinoa TaxID=63459 RepID=UPI000B799CA2|nr:WD repeat-containing protein 26-like [Chenopodium quinoa]XP_021722151.1 WD repeat-containing protein 26-like [Chenopodium quinoa]
MGIFECRTRESSPKRRKICKNSMKTENDTSSRVLGSKGLIRKHEFVRIIIQCLLSLGFAKSASCLESESGISCKSKEFEVIESEILNSKWDECLKFLNGIKELSDETRSSALFLVIRQYLMECLSHGDDSTALAFLQKRVSSLKLGTEKVHNLALDMLINKDASVIETNGNVYELRKKLLVELENLLPPPITLPERRLEHLVETVAASQIDSCLYHNFSGAVSIYEDHCCGRDQIPNETLQILTAHKNEVWFVQFSYSGEYLASSSRDCTAIIWKVVDDGKFTVKHALQSHQKAISFVAWSPDDTMLLTCGNVEVVKLWDVETGVCKRTFGDHGFIVSSCAWFPDSKKLVCGSSDTEKGICMWDCEGNELRAWRGARMPKVLDLAVTSDGNHLITVFSDKDIRILNVVTNAEHVISEEHPITSLSVSADGKFFIVNLNSQEIHLWDVEGKWRKPLKYTGHKQNQYVIRSCFGGFNSSFIASGSENSEVYIWNRQKSEPIAILSGHSMTVNSVSWNPRNPHMLASASDDHTVRVWGPAKSKADKVLVNESF